MLRAPSTRGAQPSASGAGRRMARGAFSWHVRSAKDTMGHTFGSVVVQCRVVRPGCVACRACAVVCVGRARGSARQQSARRTLVVCKGKQCWECLGLLVLQPAHRLLCTQLAALLDCAAAASASLPCWSTWSAIGNLCSRAAAVPARTDASRAGHGGKNGRLWLDARVGGVALAGTQDLVRLIASGTTSGAPFK